MFQILADQATSILKDVNGIGDLLGLVVRILSYGLGAAAIIGVVVAGILYLTARDNESQVVAAKQRLLNTVIGLIAWVVMFSVVSWLIPGGVPDPKDPSNNLQVEDADNNNPIQGGGSFGDKSYDDMTCSEKHQYLSGLGMAMGEVNAVLRDCVDGNSGSTGGGGSSNDSNNSSNDSSEWSDMTCTEKRQMLKDMGMSSGEINAVLRDEGC